MFFESQYKWILMLCCFFAYFNLQQGLAAEVGLQVQPNKCVALNQGRECFARISIRWRSTYAGDHCLYIKYIDGQELEIKCWQQKTEGQLKYEFQSSSDAQLLLRRRADNKTLASASVQVSWLYKSGSRKRRWRLF